MRRPSRTYVQRVAAKVELLFPSDGEETLPSMHKRLDVKSQSRAHACDIFVVEFFQYGGFSGIVKAAVQDLFELEDSRRR